MNEETPQIQRTPRPSGTSCFRAVGVSCLVVLVIGVAAGLWLFNTVLKMPRFRDYKTCITNAVEVGGALQRYSQRNGEFPDSLNQLYPDFLEKKPTLHCPLDKRPVDVVSYDYTRPDMKAPADTIVLTCKRHVLLDRQPPVTISLRKDGQPVTPSYSQLKNPR